MPRKTSQVPHLPDGGSMLLVRYVGRVLEILSSGSQNTCESCLNHVTRTRQNNHTESRVVNSALAVSRYMTRHGLTEIRDRRADYANRKPVAAHGIRNARAPRLT